MNVNMNVNMVNHVTTEGSELIFINTSATDSEQIAYLFKWCSLNQQKKINNNNDNNNINNSHHHHHNDMADYMKSFGPGPETIEYGSCWTTLKVLVLI